MSSPNISTAIDLAVNLDDVRAAVERIRPWVHRTPLLTSRSLSERIGVEVRLKCENLQRAGSFKVRGAMNALLQLDDDQRRRGVVAFSSGNHAQGVALSAKLLGIPATIVMPENSVQSKVEALVEAAHERGIETIAANVEDANTMAVLWQLGVNYIQGNYVQEPEVVMADDARLPA